jgi:hypothetical protein
MKISYKKGRSHLRRVSQLMVPGRREWDVQVLRSCLLPHDVVEVQKIWLSDRVEEDTIAWYYEKTGLFTVKSAYRLALQADHEDAWQDGSSKCGWLTSLPKFMSLHGDLHKKVSPLRRIGR